MITSTLRQALNRTATGSAAFAAIIIAVLLIASVYLFFSTSHPAKAQVPQVGTHTLVSSYYSLEGKMTSTLMLLNQGPTPFEVWPTLFNMTGKRLDVTPITMKGNQFREIDLRELVAKADPSFQQGSLQVLYQGKDLVLGGVVQLLDAERSLIFDEELVEPSKMFVSSRLEGVWWLPSHKHELHLVLSNTTESPVLTTISVSSIALKRQETVNLNLMPHETRIIDVRRELVWGNGGALPKAGGISIVHTGPSGAILSRAMIQEPKTGYSSIVEFYDPHRAKSSELHGSGLRLGKIGDEKLMSVAVARNVGNTDTVVKGRIPYTVNDGSKAAVDLQEIRLAPGETGIIDISEAIEARNIGERVASSGLEFKYTSEPGSVVMAAISASRDSHQVFRVPIIDPKVQRSSTGGYPWMIDGDSSTFIYIKNVTDRPQQYSMQLDFEGGLYVLGLKTVEAGQTVTLDVRALRDNQVPDLDGEVIPVDAKRGHIHWSVRGPENHVLIGRSEQVDTAKGISMTAACGLCCPDSFWQSWVDPGDAAGIIGEVGQFLAVEEDVDCYGNILAPFETNATDWVSSDTSVATCEYTGLTTAQGYGTSTITGHWNGYTWSEFGDPGEETCIPSDPMPTSPSAPCDVYEPATECDIAVRFNGSKDLLNLLTFPFGDQTLGFKDFSHSWRWQVEIQGIVSDDASTWSLRQSYNGRKREILGSDPVRVRRLNVLWPQESPEPSFRQQPPGDTVFFWIDGPGHSKSEEGQNVNYLRQVQNFTSYAVKGRRACRVRWHLRLQVDGGIITGSSAGLGHIPPSV
jgi:hypothetical protein